MKRLMPAVFLVLLFSAAVQAAPTPVRFTFRKGEKLTYAIDLHLSARAAAKDTSPLSGKSAYRGDLSGEAVLETLEVKADGTAVVKLSCSGKGKMFAGSESIDYTDTPPQPLLMVVRPDGTLLEFRTPKGQKTGLMQAGGLDLLSAGATFQMYLAGSYTVFGLQLPPKTPVPGEKWTGAHQKEEYTGGGEDFDVSKMKLELKSEPIVFNLTATTKYHDVPCLTITSPTAVRFDMAGNPHGVPGTWYFDAAQGRVVGFESHLKQWGTDKVDFDYTISLKNVAP
jgi:hypothetical protein